MLLDSKECQASARPAGNLSAPLSILRIMLTVDPRYGGPVEAVRTSSLEMAKFGHSTEILTLDEPESAHVAAFPFPVHAVRPWIRRYGYTPELAGWVRKNAERFDIAIIEGLWNHSSIGGARGLRYSGLPFVLFTHGMMDPWFRRHYPVKHWIKQLFWLLFQGRVLRDAKTVLFTCEDERRLARGVYIGPEYREQVVSFGTADAPPVEQGQAAAFYSAVPQARGRPFFLFLSRIHDKKGLDVLLPAFAQLAFKHPDIDLVVAGPGEAGLVHRLKELTHVLGIPHRVHWPGMLTGDAKWGALRQAEALALSSHSENFGIVVAEALACSTPVLISNKVNIWREIAEDGAGLVADDTQESTYAMLSTWMRLEESERASLRLRARDCFERRFHIGEATETLLAVLQQVRRFRNGA